MKTSKTTMRRRALEILEEASKNCPYFTILLREKIEVCDKVVEALKKGHRFIRLCPFPEYTVSGYDGFCSTCNYFCQNTREPMCGCSLIEKKRITLNQAINGIRIFKNVMKRYLEKNGEDSW